MKQNRRAALIVKKHLDYLFPHPDIPLHHTSPYTLLIAVLLSARCTDKKVNEITPALFALASTPESMILLTEEEIRSIIKPCGLSPRKAKAIRNLSMMLLTNFDGKVPQTLEELETLEGVGHKTASVVMTQAFAKPAFPIDTHIYRCSKRWGLSQGKTVSSVEKDLKKLFHSSLWAKLHLQIIHYARAYCPAKKHRIEKCPICLELQKQSLTK